MTRLSRATGARHKATCHLCGLPIKATESMLTVKLDKHIAMRMATPYVSNHMTCWRARKDAV